jgi:hypothetical protein
LETQRVVSPQAARGEHLRWQDTHSWQSLAGEPEPDRWLIDRVEPILNKQGLPTIFADAQLEV